MMTSHCETHLLDSDYFRAREASYVEWLPATVTAVESEWDRQAAAHAVEEWSAAELVAAYTQLTGTVAEYFQRAVNLLLLVGRRVRLSSPLPIVYAVDFELWREQRAVRSAAVVPEWEREVLRQQCHTLRLYLRVDLITDELRRRLDSAEMDLLQGGLFDRLDAYDRTVKRLRKTKGSHPDDSGTFGGEEKEGMIRVRLATNLADAEKESVPSLSPDCLDQLQLHADVLRDFQHACRITVHQRTGEESRTDRRDAGFLLRTLDGRHRYLQGEIKDDLALARRDARAKKQEPRGGRLPDSFDEILNGEGTSTTQSLRTELLVALEKGSLSLRDLLDRLLDVEMRAQTLDPKALALLQMIVESGLTETTYLAKELDVSRPTIDARKGRLETGLEHLGLRRPAE